VKRESFFGVILQKLVDDILGIIRNVPRIGVAIIADQCILKYFWDAVAIEWKGTRQPRTDHIYIK
jgi:hypothetical protein